MVGRARRDCCWCDGPVIVDGAKIAFDNIIAGEITTFLVAGSSRFEPSNPRFFFNRSERAETTAPNEKVTEEAKEASPRRLFISTESADRGLNSSVMDGTKEASPASSNDPSGPNNPSSDDNNNAGQGLRKKMKRKSLNPERDAYIDSLHSWLQTMSSCQYYQSIAMASFMASTLNSFQTTGHGATRVSEVNPNQARQNLPAQEHLFKLPSLWRRFAAGALDCLILLILKSIVTFIAIDYFGLIGLDRIDLTLFPLQALNHSAEGAVAFASSLLLSQELDEQAYELYKVAFELTSEILIIELIHRLITIVYETYFLASNLFPNRIATGAATPGKLLMNLRVVSCTSLEEVQVNNEDLIKVSPAREIGFWSSLLRSVIKNFSSLFFLPASLIVFISAHNRAPYDVVCRCVVVETRS